MISNNGYVILEDNSSMLEYVKYLSSRLYRDVTAEIEDIKASNEKRLADVKTGLLLRERIIGNYFLKSEDVAFLGETLDGKAVLKKYLTVKKNVVISGEFKIIERFCFSLCESIENLKFDEGVEQIEESVLIHKDSLKSLELPKSLKYVRSKAFGDCVNLESVSISGTRTKFTNNAFVGSKWSNSLKGDFIVFNNQLIEYRGRKRHVIIPEGIKEIVGGAFGNNKRIERITFPHSMVNIRGLFSFGEYSALSEVEFLGEGLRLIGIHAFSFCPMLKEIVLPSGLKTLGGGAFGQSTVINCKKCSKRIKNQVKKQYQHYIVE